MTREPIPVSAEQDKELSVATGGSRLSELLFDFNVPDFFMPTWKPDEKHCQHGILRVFACPACVLHQKRRTSRDTKERSED